MSLVIKVQSVALRQGESLIMEHLLQVSAMHIFQIKKENRYSQERKIK